MYYRHAVPAVTATATKSVAVVADGVNSRQAPSNSKLRLLCSYGGRITPRPNSKSLFYAGGETRVVAVDRLTTGSSFSSFIGHLSRSYNINRPFIIKYLLPSEDLDALISVTNDEDVENMIEEHDRLANIPQSSRIRLFLFPEKTDFIGSEILDPKSESWFCDALRSTKIAGLDNSYSSIEASRVNINDTKQNLDLTSVPESIVLDTSSSFGSSSSSLSTSNLGIITAHGEDSGVNLPENKVKIPSESSVESDSSNPFLQSPIYQEQIPSTIIEQEAYIIHDPPPFPGIYMPKNVYHHPPQPDQSQYIQPYIPQTISSFYPVYYSPTHNHPHFPYPPNPPYPVYVLPTKPTQTYNPVDSLDLNQEPLVQPAVDSTTKPTCENVYEEDAYNLIYKTQPATPPLLAMYYETGKAGAPKP